MGSISAEAIQFEIMCPPRQSSNQWRKSDFIFDTENQGVRMQRMTMTIDNTHTSPPATILSSWSELLVGLSLSPFHGAWIETWTTIKFDVLSAVLGTRKQADTNDPPG